MAKTRPAKKAKVSKNAPTPLAKALIILFTALSILFFLISYLKYGM